MSPGLHRVARGGLEPGFYHTSFRAGAFAAATSISAIEHGLDLERLMAEVTRLLRPGGYFLCSTDYWPVKIDTTGISVFGLTWTVFSAEEIRGLLKAARAFGLEPTGPLRFDAAAPVVDNAGKSYTFAWLALRKSLAS